MGRRRHTLTPYDEGSRIASIIAESLAEYVGGKVDYKSIIAHHPDDNGWYTLRVNDASPLYVNVFPQWVGPKAVIQVYLDRVVVINHRWLNDNPQFGKYQLSPITFQLVDPDLFEKVRAACEWWWPRWKRHAKQWTWTRLTSLATYIAKFKRFVTRSNG